jgi:hypothetical protein
LSKTWNEYLVGALADDEYVQDRTGGKSAVFINSLKAIQFALRVISRLPNGFPNVKLFHGFSQDLERHGFLDDYAAPAEERVQALRGFLQDQLLVFRPASKGQYFNITDVSLVTVPMGHRPNANYLPVPIFSQELHTFTWGQFLQKVITQQPLGQIPHISTEPGDTPPCAIWRDHLQSDQPWQLLGIFNQHRYGQGGFQLIASELHTVAFREEWENDVFEVPSDRRLLFVSESAHLAMLEQLEQSPPITLSSDQEMNQVKGGADTSVAVTLTNEQQFLQLLLQTAKDQGLLYTEADLINFHTAMKTSSLVVLAGRSGTGKSRLIQLYGHTLGMDEQQLVIIPVRPSWGDDADLLGYVDINHMVYRPGNSGLLHALSQAALNPDRLYLICLDEMNLARIEHYFSQLLSALELEVPFRRLRLYQDDLSPQLHNSHQYPATLPLGDNLLFAGTVNLDESTYHLSDKVLDRANVIKLEQRPLTDLLQAPIARRTRVAEEISAGDYRSFCPARASLGLTEAELELLQQIHQLLQTADHNLGVGHRVARQIGQYLNNLPESLAFSRADAFDRQLVQRVFSKLRGPEERLRPVIGTYDQQQEQPGSSRLLALLTENSPISHFQHCRELLLEKGRDLTLYGYTI